MATTAVQVQPTPGIFVAQQPLPPQAPKEYSMAVKNLAIVQLAIGILTIIFGIAAISSPFSRSIDQAGCGIWAGGVLTLTGLIGVFSSRDYSNGILNCIYMAHNIISSVISVIALLFFSIAIGIYDNESRCKNMYTRGNDDDDADQYEDCYRRNVCLGLNIPLLIFIIIEFSLSIGASVFCCKRACGSQAHSYSVIQQPYVTYDASGVTRVMTSNGGYVTNVQHPGQLLHQFGGHMQPQFIQQMTSHYSSQVPPAYTEHIGDTATSNKQQVNVNF